MITVNLFIYETERKCDMQKRLGARKTTLLLKQSRVYCNYIPRTASSRLPQKKGLAFFKDTKTSTSQMGRNQDGKRDSRAFLCRRTSWFKLKE